MMPGPDGQFANVIDVLNAVDKVEIIKVEQWSAIGYWWVNIRYKGRQPYIQEKLY
jgi:hypothetical protein